MSWDADTRVDWDEFGALLKIMSVANNGSDVMLVYSTKKGPVEGERAGDYKYILPVLGYAFKAQRQGQNGNKVSIYPTALYVVRGVDAATASFLSAMKEVRPDNGNENLSLFVHRSGTYIPGAANAPLIEINLTNAVISFCAIVTPSTSPVPLEFLAVTYSAIEISTAPQLESGIRGAIRSARFSDDG
jgi:hypothetical protein